MYVWHHQVITRTNRQQLPLYHELLMINSGLPVMSVSYIIARNGMMQAESLSYLAKQYHHRQTTIRQANQTSRNTGHNTMRGRVTETSQQTATMDVKDNFEQITFLDSGTCHMQV